MSEVVLVMSAGNSFVRCSSTQVSSNSSKVSGEQTVLSGTVPVGSVVRVICTSLSEVHVVSVKSAMTVL